MSGELVGAEAGGKEIGVVGVFDGGEGGDVGGGFAVKWVFLQTVVVVSWDFEGLIGLSLVVGPSPKSGEEIDEGFEGEDCAEEDDDAGDGGGGLEEARRR